MPQDIERYLYFTVALLKDSTALDALWQDALKYHMIDQPGKLIAMRLTEYYEIKANDTMPSTTDSSSLARTIHNGVKREPATIAHTPVLDDNEIISEPFGDHNDNQTETHYVESETPLATSPDVAHNAEAAAEYWTLL
ncbi:MAG: hypothetical protein JO215_02600 [Ktedonobacteraceae bacterium]|nr:hypothetical protein [Ktedonobacteraceae bacterium]MBV9616377.1 hypothetical protein [Ktedonobacteraceae bacterium]MBV9709329.1 hypothetical protein [Ktedonobacteraceae bacterium]